VREASAKEHRVTVRICARHDIGRDVRSGARPIVDDDLLAEQPLKLVRHVARDEIAGPARRKSYYEPYGTFRPRLRECNA